MGITVTRRRAIAGVAVAAAAAFGLTGCVGGAAAPSGEAGTTTLHLVGFAVPTEANNAIQKKLAETEDGKGVVWEQSYGASGDQSRAVANGLKADYVNFSLEGDVTRLVDAGLVADDWKCGPTKGIVSDSVVVIVVPEGQPQEHQGLGRPDQAGRQDRHPQPGLVGLGPLEHPGRLPPGDRDGGTEADAEDYLTKFFENVVALPGSGRDATNAFLRGHGRRADLVRERGHPGPPVGREVRLHRAGRHPADREPGGVLKDADPKAKSYLDFVLSTAGQEEFVKKGFRPVIDGIDVGSVEGANDPAEPVPDAAGLVHHRRGPRWLESGERQVLRGGDRHRAADPEGHRQVAVTAAALTTLPAAAADRHSPAGGRRRRRHLADPGRRPRAGYGDDLVQPAGADPADRDPGPGLERRLGGVLAALTSEQTAAALRLTVGQALLVTVVNIVMGTAIAWVLVRDHFPGKRILEVVIDIPFALPTIVAGLVLLSLYGPSSPLGVDWANTPMAVFLAFFFVTLPFVVRTVQPVLLELEPEVEEAAASLGASRFTDLPVDHPARAGPGHHLRRRAVLRPGHQRVRLAGAAVGQPAVLHRGRLGADPVLRRGGQADRRRRGGLASCWWSPWS